MSPNKIAAAFIILTNLKRKRAKRKPKRKFCVLDWIVNRNKQGAYNQLMTELRNGDTDFYKTNLRMDTADSDYLLGLVIGKDKETSYTNEKSNFSW